jgi:two-component sensor histidine kinase
MLKRAAEHHRKASKHLAHAARHHVKAAWQHETGRHETAAEHARTASCHRFHANRHATKALQAHVEHLDLLMREISHRSKNVLGLVQAIARQTAATGKPEDFIRRFNERVEALAANQDLLARNEWRGVDVEDLVRIQLAHFADLVGSRIALNGPKVRLKAAGAQAIGLALHELATNAGKYGALSVDTGRINVSWRLDGDTFAMNWIERNGPRVARPKRLGFGTTVITSLAKLTIAGEAELDYEPSGVTWRFTCPAANAMEPPRTELRPRSSSAPVIYRGR